MSDADAHIRRQLRAAMGRATMKYGAGGREMLRARPAPSLPRLKFMEKGCATCAHWSAVQRGGGATHGLGRAARRCVYKDALTSPDYYCAQYLNAEALEAGEEPDGTAGRS